MQFTSQAVTSMLCFIAGTVLGSFLNVVGYRIPRGESVLSPRSHCPTCQRALRAWELIPVLSWLMLVGKCSGCREPVSVRYPVMEIVTGSLFAITVHVQPHWPARFAWFVFWMLMAAVVGTDLTSMRVPNMLSIPGAAAVLLLSICCGLQPWRQALLGVVVGFGLLFFIHLLSRGKMGMGDAKLYLSIGAMLGPALCVESLILASVSGAFVGLGMRLFGLLQKREFMPFVPHIFVGVIASALYGQTLSNWYIHRLLGL